MKKEIPILFSTPMVQAVLEGRKTQTRRIIKPQPDDSGLWNHTTKPMSLESLLRGWWGVTADTGESRQYPSIEVGDLLYVRETLHQNGELGLSYVADGEDIDEAVIPVDHKAYRDYAFCNVPSIHMPKWAARIWLEVTDIRVGRLQDISEEDAVKEGIESESKGPAWAHCWKDYLRNDFDADARLSFQTLWQSINSPESWDQNPWVWVISFKVISKTGKP